MIVMEGIAKRVVLPNGQPLEILTDVSLSVAAGESVAILGRSGSGKSTLLNLLGLLDMSDAGRYTVDGRDVAELSDRDASRLRGNTFGFVFQQFHLLEGRSAAANVSGPLQHAELAAFGSRHRLAGELLDRVGLSGRAKSLPSQLSGGEQQRVAIARSLIRNPRCLLADEPTGSLDLETASTILDLLRQVVADQRCALVIVTHDPAVANRADRRLLLESGRLQELA